MPKTGDDGLHLILISVHGLIRGHDLELGRDPDTGGQTLYVVELARALAEQPGVARVDLVTRRVIDPAVSSDYAQKSEKLSERARIIRIECGPEEYLRKEDLWDHLDSFADNLVDFVHRDRSEPSLIHGHYADAGYVGQRVAHTLGLPLVFTGHSLGRVKRRRLLASGVNSAEIERRYNMSRRIDAEEETLSVARRVIASTDNEVRSQYELYDHHQPDRMYVIPPGTDLERFQPPRGQENESAIAKELDRFLTDPDKPMILAMSRPDERKNIATLVRAYGRSKELQDEANLVIVAGTRDDIRGMEDGAARVLLELLITIDQLDLYGKIAYPKQHSPNDVPELYRLAALRKGIFVNPALTEPFGLTLLEASASGLPLVATEDGGPRDIIANCHNGELINPLDEGAMAEVILRSIRDQAEWKDRSERGLAGVKRHYSWEAHASQYLDEVRLVLERTDRRPVPVLERRPMLYHDRALFTDLDQNLLGDPESLSEFIDVMRDNRNRATFGIATARTVRSALTTMRIHGIPRPDVLITSVGTRIHYAPNMTRDIAWERHIDHLWTPRTVRNVMAEVPGLTPQPHSEQSSFKISYLYDPETAPSIADISALLRQHDQTVHLIHSFGKYVDILPVRASKGYALRWFAEHWDIPLERILAAGGSGADEDMLRGNTLAVVVANRHEEELSQLVDVDRIYFAQKPFASGIREAIDHYDFFGACEVPSTT
jgi:sucrose-phosphate synthase